MSTRRFGYRFAERRTLGLIPTVEVTVPKAEYGPYRHDYVVVRRVRGLTEERALSRTFRWMREHGDPR